MAEKTEKEIKAFDLEFRKVLALEEISKNLARMTAWFEEIDKEGWDERLQWYLMLLKQAYLDPKLEKSEESNA